MTPNARRDLQQRAGAALRALWRDDGAPTAVEYALMLGGVAAAIFSAVVLFGQSVRGLFEGFASAWP